MTRPWLPSIIFLTILGLLGLPRPVDANTSGFLKIRVQLQNRAMTSVDGVTMKIATQSTVGRDHIRTRPEFEPSSTHGEFLVGLILPASKKLVDVLVPVSLGYDSGFVHHPQDPSATAGWLGYRARVSLAGAGDCSEMALSTYREITTSGRSARLVSGIVSVRGKAGKQYLVLHDWVELPDASDGPRAVDPGYELLGGTPVLYLPMVEFTPDLRREPLITTNDPSLEVHLAL